MSTPHNPTLNALGGQVLRQEISEVLDGFFTRFCSPFCFFPIGVFLSPGAFLWPTVWSAGYINCQASIRASAHYEISSETLEMAGGDGHSNVAGSANVYTHQITLGGEANGQSISANDRPTISTLDFGYLPQLNNPPVPGVVVLSRRAGLSAKVALTDLFRIDYDPDGDLYQVQAGVLTERGGTVIQGSRFIS